MQSTADDIQKAKGWVWRSTEASIASEKMSVCAVLEVPLATAFYFALAYYSPWPWFSLLACLAAPLLLLRSKKSVELGQEMLRRYWTQVALNKRKTWVVSAVATALSFVVSFALASHWLAELQGWSLWWRSALSGSTSAVVAYVVMFAFAGPATYAPRAFFAGALGALGAAYVSGCLVYFCALIGIVVLAATGALMTITGLGVLVGVFSAALFQLSFFPGLSLRATLIRILATVRYAHLGVSDFSQNWRETVLVVDLFEPPSFLPGAEKVQPNFSARFLCKTDTANTFEATSKYLQLVFMYIPALLYRWNIKASAWLWGPLAFALRPAAWANDEQMRASMAWRTTSGLIWGMFLVALSFCLWLLAPWLPDGLSTELPVWMVELTGLLPVPALNLRTGLLTLTLISWLSLIWVAYLLRSAHEAPLGDSDNLEGSTKVTKESFRSMAKPVRITGQWTATLMFLTVWTYALAWALNRWPEPIQHFVWDWLKPWL